METRGAERVAITVAKQDMKFSSAHFICHAGCRERLHGHNYQLAVRLHGPRLGPDGYLLDFGAVKAAARRLCKELDEYVLVPERNRHHTVRTVRRGSQVEVQCDDGSFFSFPSGDCRLLPVAHTSCEELCRYLWDRLAQEVPLDGLDWMEVELTETAGQSAAFGNRPRL